jgi:hypothetical protein
MIRCRATKMLCKADYKIKLSLPQLGAFLRLYFRFMDIYIADIFHKEIQAKPSTINS